MPSLSQLMQGGPGNVFGGFGQGLGSGIGAGVTKQIRRPLFNSPEMYSAALAKDSAPESELV